MMHMATVRINTTIPEEEAHFIHAYKQAHKEIKSDSAVISKALRLLREQELKQQYLEANSEIDDDLENLDMDGLNDQACNIY